MKITNFTNSSAQSFGSNSSKIKVVEEFVQQVKDNGKIQQAIRLNYPDGQFKKLTEKNDAFVKAIKEEKPEANELLEDVNYIVKRDYPDRCFNELKNITKGFLEKIKPLL